MLKTRRSQQKQLAPPPIVDLSLFRLSRRTIVINGILYFALLMIIPVVVSVIFVDPTGVINGFTIAFGLGMWFLFLDLAAVILKSLKRYYLIVSPVGIEYGGNGYNLRTSWNHLTTIGKVNFSFGSSGGVLVRRGQLDLPRSYEISQNLMPWVQILMALQGRVVSAPSPEDMAKGIPLKAFDPDWHTGQTPLGMAIQKYAPQVFGLPAPSGPVPAPDTFPPSLRSFVPSQSMKAFWGRTALIILLQLAVIPIITWWWNGGSNVQVIGTDIPYIQNLSFSSDDQTFYVVSPDLLQFGQISQENSITKVDGLPSFQYAMLSPDQTRVAIGSYDSVSVWEIADGHASLVRTMLERNDNDLMPYVESLALSPDGNSVAIGMENGTLRLWSIADGQVLKSIQDNGDTTPIQLVQSVLGYSYSDERAVKEIQFSPDGSWIAFSDGNYDIQLCQLSTVTCLPVGEGEYNTYTEFSFSLDSRMLAIGSYNGQTELYTVETLERLYTFTAESSVSSFAFTSNGSILAIGRDNGTIDLWDLNDGTKIMQIRGHADTISALVFLRDNLFLASGSTDETIRLWEVEQQ